MIEHLVRGHLRRDGKRNQRSVDKWGSLAMPWQEAVSII
jgi:hypothetical protein